MSVFGVAPTPLLVMILNGFPIILNIFAIAFFILASITNDAGIKFDILFTDQASRPARITVMFQAGIDVTLFIDSFESFPYIPCHGVQWPAYTLFFVRA